MAKCAQAIVRQGMLESNKPEAHLGPQEESHRDKPHLHYKSRNWARSRSELLLCNKVERKMVQDVGRSSTQLPTLQVWRVYLYVGA